MAEREVGTELTTTGGSIRHITTAPKTSDEAKAAEDHCPDTTVPMPTDTAPPAQEVQAANNGNPVPGWAVLGIVVSIAAMAIIKDPQHQELSEPWFTICLVSACFAFAALTISIQHRDTYVEFAKTAEKLGIALAAIAFYAVMAFFLPLSALWVPAVCIIFILVFLAIPARQPAPT